jgi:hypothetical protein
MFEDVAVPSTFAVMTFELLEGSCHGSRRNMQASSQPSSSTMRGTAATLTELPKVHDVNLGFEPDHAASMKVDQDG